MFFVHDRGRMLSVYLFGQQLGSMWVSFMLEGTNTRTNTCSCSLGLITGGSIADSIGWRWSQYIVAIIDAGLLVLLFFTFEETLFPRFLFSSNQQSAPVATVHDDSGESGNLSMDGKKESNMVQTVESRSASGFVDEFPKRTYLQTLSLWVYYPQNKTTFFQYFRRPFFLWAFPNIVIVSDT
jgi:MFS family permease